MRRDLLCTAVLAVVVVVVCSACSEEPVVQRSDLPISEDFSHGCNWAVDHDAASNVGCANGVYRAIVLKPQIRPHHVIPRRFDPVPAVTVAADVTLARLNPQAKDRFAAFGLGCWSSPHGVPGFGYVFDIAPDGSAAIFRNDEGDSSLRRNYYMKQLDSAPKVVGFDASAPTRITATCEDRHGTVNLVMRMGDRVLTAVDHITPRKFQAAGFDVFAVVPSTTVEFDNVEIHAGASG